MDILVKPDSPVIDYNSRFSGLTKDLVDEAKYDLKKARERFLEFVNSETILIGHSLESDLKALRIVHQKIVDTSDVFPHERGLPYKKSLKNIFNDIFHSNIQENGKIRNSAGNILADGHDSKEDASACMRLMLHKVKFG
ncbi:unnamed protein product [Dracunculus medinensis]|uniref:Exonuclease domain-containing protein n=1 Tax=Dracunculus medinensis TaxID=318479 RepID=A0A0N4URL4_DRAME|nr:unnamed protein product [Dracunculus medinensis]